jgi:hypothetical protein
LASIVQINPPGSCAYDVGSLVAYVPLAGICAHEASVLPGHVFFGSLKRHVHSFQSGDVLLPIIASGLAGNKIAQVDAQWPHGLCSPEIAVLRVDDAVVHPRFLLHWLRQQGAPALLPLLRGTTIQRIGIDDLLQLEMPLPPLRQQALCAQLMDVALAQRKVSERYLRNAEQMIPAVWRQAMRLMDGQPHHIAGAG